MENTHLNRTSPSANIPPIRSITLKRGGLKLQGRLERKTSRSCPLVMMLHGFGGDMWVAPDSWFQRLSDELTDAGLATLRFDFNGHGQSEGNFHDMTPYNEIEDAAAFLKYARSMEDITDIYVLGHSQGGVIGGMLAGYYHDVVSRLVMLAPAASLKDDAQQGRCMAASYNPDHIPYSVNVDGRHEVGGLFFRMAQSLPIYEVTAQFTGSAMAVFCGADPVVKRASVFRYGQTLSNCRVLEKKTLDHGLQGEEHDELMKEIIEFLTSSTTIP